ncbi:MAG: hypothetical protein ACJA1L_000607 [Paracoccaceae bacterium]|jgi:hypothetical protein
MPSVSVVWAVAANASPSRPAITAEMPGWARDRPAPMVGDPARRAATKNIGLTEPSRAENPDRLRPCGRKDRTARAHRRSDEPARLDQRTRDQRRAEIALAALDQEKLVGMHPAAHRRGAHRLGHSRPCREGRERPAANAAAALAVGERQPQVRRAGHRDGADRRLHPPQFRAQGGLAGWQRGVNPAVEAFAPQDMPREPAKPAGGAAPLSLQSPDRQAGLLAADLRARVGAGLKLVGDGPGGTRRGPRGWRRDRTQRPAQRREGADGAILGPAGQARMQRSHPPSHSAACDRMHAVGGRSCAVLGG